MWTRTGLRLVSSEHCPLIILVQWTMIWSSLLLSIVGIYQPRVKSMITKHCIIKHQKCQIYPLSKREKYFDPVTLKYFNAEIFFRIWEENMSVWGWLGAGDSHLWRNSVSGARDSRELGHEHHHAQDRGQGQVREVILVNTWTTKLFQLLKIAKLFKLLKTKKLFHLP